MDVIIIDRDRLYVNTDVNRSIVRTPANHELHTLDACDIVRVMHAINYEYVQRLL